MLKTKSLTPHEYDIIINKATEKPFTGRYNDLDQKAFIFVVIAVHHYLELIVSLSQLVVGQVMIFILIIM